MSAATSQMDQLQGKNLIQPGTRRNLLGNELVLIVNKESPANISSFRDLTKTQVKQFGLGEPKTVPAGQYGQQVLESAGIWDEVKDKAVLTKDVQVILTYVETKNVEAGIVFSTVAATSDKVKIVARAAAGTHEEIVFPGAIISSTKQPKAAEEFLSYLSGPEAVQVFEKYGFRVIPVK